MSDAGAILIQLLATSSPTPIPGTIVKMTGLGFLVQLTQPGQTQSWQTGDRLQAQFSLPKPAIGFDEPIKVVKAYLKWAQQPGSKDKIKLQIFEMHFLSLAGPKKSVIEQFVAIHKAGDKSDS